MVCFLLDAATSSGVFEDVVTHVSHKVGGNTTLTCPQPENEEPWVDCKFQHHNGTKGECSVEGENKTMNCPAFDNADLRIEQGQCKLRIESVTDVHNGTWSCSVMNRRKIDAYHQYFTITVLHEPSNIETNPSMTAGKVYFKNLEPFYVSITIHNVAPIPKVYWLIDNQNIDTTQSIETSVDYRPQYWEVEQQVGFIAREEFDSKELKYKLVLEVVDEFGNISEGFTSIANVTLICNDCNQETTVSTLSSSTNALSSTPTSKTDYSSTTSLSSTITQLTVTSDSLSTTKQTTSTTNSRYPTTTPSFSTISSTITEPTVTTGTTYPTTTQTTPTSHSEYPKTTTSSIPPVDCSFNLTGMSGDVSYPKPGKVCNLDPNPSWTINVNCNGNCINIINIVIYSMAYESTNPCDSQLRVTTNSGDGDRLM